MRYLVLRTCFVNDRLWREGDVYELPENMHKSPKNFKPIDVPQVVAVTATTETESPPAEVIKETKPRKKSKRKSR